MFFIFGSEQVTQNVEDKTRLHPRTLGWLGTTAVAIGGSNQSLFLIGALIIGQNAIPGQGSAAILLLIFGLLLGWAATPGWLELVLMYPNRVGGIAATCVEAFRPYSPVLANLTGVCYWWGWVPTCGIAALISAAAIHQWYLPWVPVPYLATIIVLIFTWVNLRGIYFTTKVACVIASIAATLAFLSGLIPIIAGTVNWHQATTFHLTTPFPGLFGDITSLMAGLYLVGFAAPAFEQATCHVGETRDPEKNVPRSVFAAAIMASIYFILLPVVWLGTIGSDALAKDLTEVLGPVFAPLFGNLAKSAAIWFITLNMFHGTLAPLAGASRAMSQLAEDGLVPKWLAKRNSKDAPSTSTILMALMSIVFLWAGDPIWLIAAANFTYLIGISLPNVAVWLLRRNEPEMRRPFRAPRGTIVLGLIAASIWGASTLLGFQQFGLPTVMVGLVFAYAGAGLYAWRKFSDRREKGLPGIANTLHIKLTGSMLLVLFLDGVGYLIAVNHVSHVNAALIAGLEDIFVCVALLTIAVGLILPGMIANSAVEVSKAAENLAKGTVGDFSKALLALGKGDIDEAGLKIDITPVISRTRDEVGDMAISFNVLQEEIRRAATGFEGAKKGLKTARKELIESNIALKEMNETLEKKVSERTKDLKKEMVAREHAESGLLAYARQAGMAEVSSSVLHNVGNVLNPINVTATIITDMINKSKISNLSNVAKLIESHKDNLAQFIGEDPKGQELMTYISLLADYWNKERVILLKELEGLTSNVQHIKDVIRMQQSLTGISGLKESVLLQDLLDDAIKINTADISNINDINDINDIKIKREYTDMGRVLIDKPKLMQILVNLLQNAKESCLGYKKSDNEIIIRSKLDADKHINIEIVDTGEGIHSENITKIFSYGFTTKKNGHGVGLHASAISVKEMGGSIIARSDGIGKGAMFTLTLPYSPQNGE